MWRSISRTCSTPERSALDPSTFATNPLEHVIGEVERVIERLDEDSLILAVHSIVVDRQEKPGEAVYGNSGIAEIETVRRAGLHRRRNGNRPPHRFQRRVDRGE